MPNNKNQPDKERVILSLGGMSRGGRPKRLVRRNAGQRGDYMPNRAYGLIRSIVLNASAVPWSTKAKVIGMERG